MHIGDLMVSEYFQYSMIRTTKCIHPMAKVCYFEMTVRNAGEGAVIGIGLSKTSIKDRNGVFPGWGNGSIGYHGDDGKLFRNSSTPLATYEPYSTGDTVGCCLRRMEIRRKTLQFCFFTLNGRRLEPTWNLEGGDFFPTIGMGCSGAKVETNLGQKEFVFNIIGKSPVLLLLSVLTMNIIAVILKAI